MQVYAPTSNAEEAEVEQFYEDLQDLLELTLRKDVLFIIEDWKATQFKNGQRFLQRSYTGLPGCPLVKNLCCQCTRRRSDPWSGNEDPACHAVVRPKEKKEAIQVASEHKKRRLITLVIKGMQFIITITHHFTPTG